MNLRELIFESELLISKIENKEKSISFLELSQLLEIPPKHLFELFENENIYIGTETNTSISIDLLKQILLKEPEISSSPKNLAKLLLSSNKLLEKLDKSKIVRLNQLCRSFNIGVKNINELFIKEGMELLT